MWTAILEEADCLKGLLREKYGWACKRPEYSLFKLMRSSSQ